MSKEKSFAPFISRQMQENPGLCDELAAVPGLCNCHSPPISDLAAYKDRMRISDHDWPITVKTFGLGKYARLTAIRKQRNHDNKTMSIRPISDTGYEIPLHAYLQHRLKLHPPSDPKQPVLLKLAFDGATITSGKRIQQEVGGFQILTPGETLASVKSPKNCHVFVLYIGGETDEELREALTTTNEVIPTFFLCC